MEDWVQRALTRWPDVPALYDWLSLDRRGRWRVRGGTISRRQIIDTINANYAGDDDGCWYFQNGPQRGYVALASAPLILWSGEDNALTTHTGKPVTHADAAWLDEDGTLYLSTEFGPAALDDREFDWLLAHLTAGHDRHRADEHEIGDALAQAPDTETALGLRLGADTLVIKRLLAESAPARLGFCRSPRPAAP